MSNHLAYISNVFEFLKVSRIFPSSVVLGTFTLRSRYTPFSASDLSLYLLIFSAPFPHLSSLSQCTPFNLPLPFLHLSFFPFHLLFVYFACNSHSKENEAHTKGNRLKITETKYTYRRRLHRYTRESYQTGKTGTKQSTDGFQHLFTTRLTKLTGLPDPNRL